jgi:hypothetical protein
MKNMINAALIKFFISFYTPLGILTTILFDDIVKNSETVTPAPIFIGINSSRSPEPIEIIPRGAGLSQE